jgi:DNA replication protein DnaC
LLIEQRVPPTLYKSEWFASPFDKGVEVLMQPGSTREDVAKVLSSAYINDAHDAVKKWNGLGETENFDWPKVLRESYENMQRGKVFEKLAKKYKNNEPVDLLALYSEIGSAIAKESFGLKPASEIDYKKYKPFMLSGYEPIDKTLGGIPTDGPIIVYGNTGVGKSKFAAALTNGILHQYPKKKAAIFTLEMNEVHWMSRTMKLFPSFKEVLPRLFVSGQARDIEDVVAQVTVGQFDFVVLDDMDNMVKSSEASEYERIYRRVKEVCRFCGIPFVVLGQPNRTAKIETSPHLDKKTNKMVGGRFLGRFDVAWSGAAENSAALQIALQTTNALDTSEETFPTSDDDMDYLIFWKSRDGWPGDYDPTKAIGPGAVVMKHSANWMGSPYGDRWKLWSVDSGRKAIGKSRRNEE